MTYFATAFEFVVTQPTMHCLTPPRSPEEVIELLIAEAPEGEHSVDAM